MDVLPPHTHVISPAPSAVPSPGPPTLPPAAHRLSPVALSVASTTTSMMAPAAKPVYSSPPPAHSSAENNTCRLIEYRGVKVAAFVVDGRELICLPQAFELFLKHLVGGLHTVYTKLKRLDVVPIVCNVEQVRILRGLGAIQPGVNRCKLIAPNEFDTLYEDCTNSNARPGRPPKRSSLSSLPDAMEKLKKSRLDAADYGYSPARLMDFKKTALFAANGYHHYPTHLTHIPFMPMGHPAMMGLAMANHLGIRPELNMMPDRRANGTDLSSPRKCLEEEIRAEHINNNNNNNNNNMPLNLEKPINLEMHKNDSRRHSITDRDSVVSAGSEIFVNGQLDLSTKSAMHSGMDDIDLDDGSDGSDDDDIDSKSDDCDVPRSLSMATSMHHYSGNLPKPLGEKAGAHKATPFPSQLLGSAAGDAAGISSIDNLLMNIQGLLKVAMENARHHEQQTNYEKAELKMEIMRERDARQTLEKQLLTEQKNKAILQKKLKKERKVRRRLQEQMGVVSEQSTLTGTSSNDIISQTHSNMRMLSESVSQEVDIERRMSPDTERKLTGESHVSGIQNLMETFLSSAAAVAPPGGPTSTSCNGAAANGYLHSPVIKKAEAV